MLKSLVFALGLLLLATQAIAQEPNHRQRQHQRRVVVLPTTEWYDGAWGCRQKLTVLASQVDEDLVDFPVYVDLADLGTEFHDKVNLDGSDIRITESDKVTEVPREVVVIDTGTETGELHFKASSLSSSQDTDFYLYYCNDAATEPAASSTFGSENVWTNGYVGVWHLQEEQAGTGNVDLYQDSTANANHGDDEVGNTGQDGQIEAGQDLDGTDDYIPTSSTELATANNFTISAWFNADSTAFAMHLLWQGDGAVNGWGDGIDDCTNNEDEFHLTIGEITDANSMNADVVSFWMGCTITTLGGNINMSTAFTDTSGAFHYVAAKVENISTSPTAELYLDGVSADTDTANTADLTRDAFDTGFRMARPGAATRFHDGNLDEVRAADIARTDEWVSTVFNNQDSPSTFYVISVPELF